MVRFDMKMCALYFKYFSEITISFYSSLVDTDTW